jgi:hypothetical protein
MSDDESEPLDPATAARVLEQLTPQLRDDSQRIPEARLSRRACGALARRRRARGAARARPQLRHAAVRVLRAARGRCFGRREARRRARARMTARARAWRRASVVPLLLATMRRHVPNAFLQTTGCMLLAWVGGDSAWRARAIADGALEAVIEALAHHSRDGGRHAEAPRAAVTVTLRTTVAADTRRAAKTCCIMPPRRCCR